MSDNYCQFCKNDREKKITLSELVDLLCEYEGEEHKQHAMLKKWSETSRLESVKNYRENYEGYIVCPICTYK